MKKTLLILVLSGAVLGAVFAGGNQETTTGRGNGAGNGTYQSGNGAGRQGGGANSNATAFSGENMSAAIADIEMKDLDTAEKAGILQMREEEKLARDVYNTLYAKWNIPVFTNIAKAEQTHMDAIGLLIERYNLNDPIKTDVPGKFENEELQKLYTSLTEKGSASLKDALTVGATVEDLDIADLEKLIAQTDNDDIKIIYQNLNKGSRNHMRAFYSQLERNNAGYKAQYISSDYLNKIINSNRETGTLITDPNFTF